MHMNFSQQMRMSQQMKLAPRMIQSMEILQLPLMELQERIDQEMSENPTLLAGPDLDTESQTERQIEITKAKEEATDTPIEARELKVEENGNNEADFERLVEMHENWNDDSFNYESRPSAGRMAENDERHLDQMASIQEDEPTLTEHLLEQFHFYDIPPAWREFGDYLIYNLDALFGSGSAFHRIRSRKAPDNAYTSTASLTATAARNRYPATMVTGLPTRLFADDAPLASRPASGSITIPYGTGSTSYAYDRATNSYLRSVAGRAQIDSMDGKRVVARDVVVLFMRLSIDPQSEVGHHRPVLDQIGSGTAWVFRDGQVIKGTWRKKDQGDLTRFLDSTGAEISLVRGRIFIQVVPTGTKVSYKAAG